MSRETGGSAFPVVAENGLGHYVSEGMTMRDYFAAKAMEACLTNERWFESTIKTSREFGIDGIEGVAKSAYAIADLMLAERAK